MDSRSITVANVGLQKEGFSAVAGVLPFHHAKSLSWPRNPTGSLAEPQISMIDSNIGRSIILPIKQATIITEEGARLLCVSDSIVLPQNLLYSQPKTHPRHNPRKQRPAESKQAARLKARASPHSACQTAGIESIRCRMTQCHPIPSKQNKERKADTTPTARQTRRADTPLRSVCLVLPSSHHRCTRSSPCSSSSAPKQPRY